MPDDLFQFGRKAQIEQESPLANRMRPRTLDEYVGQQHIIGPGRLLRRAIEADQLSSLIFYGPPGTGKTTLARVIANTTETHFITINAVLSGVKEIRESIADAQERRNLYNQRTTLFVDEVHRWNKAQQDALLPHVENGTIILIGATTENPYFEVNKALVSRSRIFQLKPLTEDDLRQIIAQTLADEGRGYGRLQIEMTPAAVDHLVNVANGDARSVLNALELAVETTPPDAEDGVRRIDLAVAEESIQRRAVLYDKDGDAHYDTISAFIKSLRGSDPDAALYWAAKMIYAGEDPRFIFRRMGIFAGEDVGLADPHAAAIVDSCWALYERIGMPEGQFPLAKAILYLATAPKSNSTLGFFDALKAVQEEAEAEVPNHLKDGNRDKEGFGHGIGYKYPHAYQDHWVAQQYLPSALQGKLFYQPNDQGYEGAIIEQVQARREAQLALLLSADEEAAEILTMSPERRGREAWLQRTMSNTGETLRRVREAIFVKAQIARHHLVLDLRADNGLLLWEAVRQAPEGGVWGIASEATFPQLSQLAGRLLDLEQPTLHLALDDVLASGQTFERLIAYNPLTRLLEQRDELTRWSALLQPQGTLTIAQVIPRRGQRIYELLNWSTAEKKWQKQVQQAEGALWQAADNPSTAWDVEDLQRELAAAGWSGVIEPLVFNEDRRLSAGMVRRWFEPDNPYRAALAAAGLSDDALDALAEKYAAQLAGQTVRWQVEYGLGYFSLAAHG